MSFIMKKMLRENVKNFQTTFFIRVIFKTSLKKHLHLNNKGFLLFDLPTHIQYLTNILSFICETAKKPIKAES